MNGLYNLYIPMCALFVSMLCGIVFFFRERARNKETAIFARMLIYSLIDSMMMVIIIYLSLFTNINVKILEFLNKIDYSMYILFTSNLFLYVYYVTTTDDETQKNKSYNIFFYSTTIIDIILICLLAITKVNVHIEGTNLYSDGPSLNYAIIGCGIYFITMVTTLIYNFRKAITKKLVPLYTLIILFILVMILNRVDKSIVIISAILSYVNLIMLFTIENPDMKLLRQAELAKDQALSVPQPFPD